MTRTDRAKRVDPMQAERYAEVGRHLLAAARDLDALDDTRHANAMAILAVHAAIAAVDAATIHLAARKSTSADHHAAARLLVDSAGTRLPSEVAQAHRRLLAEKDQVAYAGHVVGLREARAALTRAERVAAWTEHVMLTVPRPSAS